MFTRYRFVVAQHESPGFTKWKDLQRPAMTSFVGDGVCAPLPPCDGGVGYCSGVVGVAPGLPPTRPARRRGWRRRCARWPTCRCSRRPPTGSRRRAGELDVVLPDHGPARLALASEIEGLAVVHHAGPGRVGVVTSLPALVGVGSGAVVEVGSDAGGAAGAEGPSTQYASPFRRFP